MKRKKYFIPYLMLTFANLIAALNFNLLAKPINLVSGGSGGLALVLGNVVNLSTSHLITIIYIITFILGLIFLDRKKIYGIIYASITYPLFVYLTEKITMAVVLNYKDIFLVTIIAALITGISNGLIYKYGFASSGLGIISPIINKYFKVSISLSNFLINAIIVLFGGYFFGFNVVLLAILYLYLSNYICNRIILGVSQNKVLFIKSDKKKEVVELLKNKYKINATIFDNKIIMAVIKSPYYIVLKNDLLRIDNDVFFTTNDCYEVRNKIG